MVFKRPQALVDLAEIWAYIADDSPAHADSFADLIDSTFQALARHAGMGRTRTDLGRNIRRFGVGRYVIFYSPTASGIEIVRVLHGMRDIEAVFQHDAE